MATAMQHLGGSLSAALARLRRATGSSSRLGALRRRALIAKAANAEQIEALKDEIRSLEARARAKKVEYDESRGEVRRIVAGEIRRLFSEIDSLQGRERIVTANLDRLAFALTKQEELEAADRCGIGEEEWDDLAIEMEMVLEKQRRTDRAMRELDPEAFKPERAEPPRPVAAPPVPSAPARDPEADLPEDIRERMGELEAS